MSMRLRRVVRTAVALLVGAAVWLPCVHFFFRPDVRQYRRPTGMSPVVRELAARHLAMWEDPERLAAELGKMRASNAEWDFMGRTFVVLGLVNMAMGEEEVGAREEQAGARGVRGLPGPGTARFAGGTGSAGERGRFLAVVDRMIEETVRLEEENGFYHFLMPYARNSDYVEQPARSLFVDGEMALMMAARRMVEEKEAYREPMRERLAACVARMKRSPVLLAESYPDECWVFDHLVALAALRLGDALDGTDHAAFCAAWIAMAKQRLVDPRNGLLCSYATTRGNIGDGPEGSTLWMAVHCLALLDEAFARDQYERAKAQLSRRLLGFAWASEWPRGYEGGDDIDSGPTIPLLEVSAGSSGMAFIAAATFEDEVFLRELLTTLEFAAFPVRRGGELRYAASNQVGDAVLLYALVQGPLWRAAKEWLGHE